MRLEVSSSGIKMGCLQKAGLVVGLIFLVSYVFMSIAFLSNRVLNYVYFMICAPGFLLFLFFVE
jgi:hypothetical protein